MLNVDNDSISSPFHLPFLPLSLSLLLSLSLWLFVGCCPLLKMAVCLPVTPDPSFQLRHPRCVTHCSDSSVPASVAPSSCSPSLLASLCFSPSSFPTAVSSYISVPLRRPQETRWAGTENGPDLCSTQNVCYRARRAWRYHRCTASKGYPLERSCGGGGRGDEMIFRSWVGERRPTVCVCALVHFWHFLCDCRHTAVRECFY